LHDSLMARLDRLDSVKRVAQIGAAIGREFPYMLLRIVSGLHEDELQAALGRLVASGLVFQRGTPPDAVYSFKHALVQEAAHSSLLRSARQQLHARVAEVFEVYFPEVMETQPEILAQHYAEAGLVGQSVAYWGKAGHSSAARSAMAEAAAQFQRGLDQLALLPDDPERQRQELGLLSALGAALQDIKGQGALETGQVYARAREMWEQLGAPSEFLWILYAQSLYHAIRGELDLAQRLDKDLLRRSQQSKNFAGLVLGHASSGRNLMSAGRFALSRSHFQETLSLYDPAIHQPFVHQRQLSSQAALGIALFCLGFPDQASVSSNAAIAEARRLAHPRSLAMSLSYAAKLLSLVGDDAALGERAHELVALATEQGFPAWRAHGTVHCGWVKVKNGDVAEGVALMRGGSAALRVTAEQWAPYFRGFLARACEIAGQVGEALALLDEALQIVEETGQTWFATELNRHKGQLLLRQGHTDVAEELYHKALSIAREQEAKLWELRAAASLARLWRDQGREAEARDLLASVYGWFTEGFATPDLKEAKALLDDLA